MKIKEELNLDTLLEYGFEKVNKEEEGQGWDTDYTIVMYDYMFTIGHSRRGQFYYLLVNEKDRLIDIYAPKPDGDGTSIKCPDVLIQLMKNNIIE